MSVLSEIRELNRKVDTVIKLANDHEQQLNGPGGINSRLQNIGRGIWGLFVVFLGSGLTILAQGF